MTQPVIEWLLENIHIIPKFELSVEDILEQAKQMEKEQTEAAYHDGVNDARNNSLKYAYYKDKKKNIHIERSPEWP